MIVIINYMLNPLVKAKSYIHEILVSEFLHLEYLSICHIREAQLWSGNVFKIKFRIIFPVFFYCSLEFAGM